MQFNCVVKQKKKKKKTEVRRRISSVIKKYVLCSKYTERKNLQNVKKGSKEETTEHMDIQQRLSFNPELYNKKKRKLAQLERKMKKNIYIYIISQTILHHKKKKKAILCKNTNHNVEILVVFQIPKEEKY